MNIQQSELKQENYETRKVPAKVQEQLGINDKHFDSWMPVNQEEWLSLQKDYWTYLNNLLNNEQN